MNYYAMKNHRADDTRLNYVLWRVDGKKTEAITLQMTPAEAKAFLVDVIGARFVSPIRAAELGLMEVASGVMTKVDVQSVLASGRSVTDIGQLSDKARQWLRSAVRSGRVEKQIDYSYPKPKNLYVAVADGGAVHQERNAA